ncbi:hypothetical protein A1Q1_02798 [Trichosporon asahii var. asahii CBS 2479]|uniref:FHA domain-containing protein n=1 Tax=Trichosporon asahii var. asahii (strain ATCC 90039 / CBS 2479 / JCM 2466 / KCTC 7840 / NBRC 103889/ NCYC 2677 / UAMH 7654) TaxID=1186058 RepID=J6EZD3_TRIAS|nr:hypothetical protein A1Q1_02798 [Trichosporon asahii var. asahii CBS 2479]EJT48232.1 hypothetical protein A1Q1_02798 [Trichosporon asahii var. asahii CBS 2479]
MPRSPRDRSPRGYGRSRSPPPRSRDDRDRRDRRDRDRSRSPKREPGWGDEYTAKDRERERERDRKRYDEDVAGDKEKSPPKPNMKNTGLLAKESNMVKGVALKYHEPPEARKPVVNWRLYVFKGSEQVDLIHIYRQSCYLLGRDAVVTDILIEHPSCSKQHAVIQFRQITKTDKYGKTTQSVKPFVIDLDSTNGTWVNGEEIPQSRYYELRSGDIRDVEPGVCAAP